MFVKLIIGCVSRHKQQGLDYNKFSCGVIFLSLVRVIECKSAGVNICAVKETLKVQLNAKQTRQ
jgi:hypothetical protein